MNRRASGTEPFMDLSRESKVTGVRYVVGAVITDGAGRAYMQRRSPRARHFPGCWDIVGGHVEENETLEQALAREIREETGWELARIHGIVGTFDWPGDDGVTRREIDVLAEVTGDLSEPTLETEKFTDHVWADEEELRRMQRAVPAPDAAMIRLCLQADCARIVR
ncbi:NUDIX domain-containing protein [Haloechinothrix sp. LS1_15]|uniref:NUDIX hydrolase n=1 Tax=Haloechinothrix sp. LS1_15 TaxID=2652248 RepID=UPI002944DB0F|nr:NUDIX domain-containing protein [Haloechinothrix sp. LS1_15]MDV6013788.1 NUDIX domain-containing protein [Haloechinothrix sp. LS1_15]